MPAEGDAASARPQCWFPGPMTQVHRLLSSRPRSGIKVPQALVTAGDPWRPWLLATGYDLCSGPHTALSSQKDMAILN